MAQARWILSVCSACLLLLDADPVPAQSSRADAGSRRGLIGPVSLESISQPDTHPPPPIALTPQNAIVRISVGRRRLWVIAGGDTVLRAMVAVGRGRSFTYAGTQWRFSTPRGRLFIRGKRTDPVWIPPDWHYAEVAARHRLGLARLSTNGRLLRNGSRLSIRDSVVGLIPSRDTTFLSLPTSEHIVFDRTLFIPPIGTLNRQMHGELGAYALDLGDGYMIHGTADPSSIGSDRTHGCIRLGDADLLWLYTYVPVGVPVIIR